MFNFSFAEILVIAVVGLLVIGPENLPRVARQLGHWARWFRNNVGNAKADILREMELEDAKSIHREFTDMARGANAVFRSATQSVTEEVGKIQADVAEENPKPAGQDDKSATAEKPPPSVAAN